MSRLIDADETKRAFVGNRYGSKAIEYVIDEAPTVKAIPIEWIDEYTTRLVIKRRFLVENGYQDIQDDRYSDYISGIMGMLDDWEKENEQGN